MGEISFVEIGQVFPALEASSAISQAIRLGSFSCSRAKGGGITRGGGTFAARDQRTYSVCVKGVFTIVYSVIIKACDSELRAFTIGIQISPDFR
jgi:hypothetical protein